jgi:cytochrome c-type biogenesis protein CcmF
VVFVVGAFIVGVRSVYGLLCFAFAGFALVSNLREFATGTRARMRAHGERVPQALGRLIRGNQRRYGGYLAHVGMLTATLGIAASSTFRAEFEATLVKGQSMPAGRYQIRLDDIWGREEAQRTVLGVTVSVLSDSRAIGVLDPRMNFYPTSDQPVPTPAVRSRLWGDIYVNLQAFERDGSNATLRVIIEPLVPWIWFGGGIVCLGALVSMVSLPRRAAYAVAAVEASSPTGAPRPATASAQALERA